MRAGWIAFVPRGRAFSDPAARAFLTLDGMGTPSLRSDLATTVLGAGVHSRYETVCSSVVCEIRHRIENRPSRSQSSGRPGPLWRLQRFPDGWRCRGSTSVPGASPRPAEPGGVRWAVVFSSRRTRSQISAWRYRRFPIAPKQRGAPQQCSRSVVLFEWRSPSTRPAKNRRRMEVPSAAGSRLGPW